MISPEEIEGLAALARLKLREGEAESLRKDISDILGYVGQISALEPSATEGLPPLRNVLREDIVRSEDDPLAGTREALLEALPRRDGDFAVVKKIIQKDE